MNAFPILTMDFLKAGGELGFPVLTHLLPGFLVGKLFGIEDGFSEIAAASTFSVELFLSVVVLGLAFGLKRPVVYMAAWIACLLVLPLFIPTLTYIRVWGNPHLLTALMLNSFSIAAFYRIGRPSGLSVAQGSAVIFLMQAYAIVTLGYAMPMGVPFVGVVFITLTFLGGSKEETTKKLISMIIILSLTVFIFGKYLIGLYLYTKPGFFWPELLDNPIDYRDMSYFLHRHETAGVFGAAIYYSSAGLAVALVMFGRDGARKLALCLLSLVLAIAACLFGIEWVWGSWKGSPMGYVDLMALPLHVLIISIAAHALIAFVGKRFAEKGTETEIRNRLSASWYGLAILPWGALVLSIVNADRLKEHGPWPWPPRETPIIEFARQNIEIGEDRVFRGRIVNLAGREGGSDNLFINQHSYDHGTLVATGNDHRQYGFWYYNVPTLLSASQFTSPMFHFATTRFLIRPHSRSLRTHVAYEIFDQRMLRAFGVRYVIDDHVSDEHLLKMSLPIPGQQGRSLYLHELPGPNLGNDSPVHSIRISNVKQAISEMSRPSWDYRKSIVSSFVLPDYLVPVTSSKLRTRKGYLEVEAKSPGTSALLLPFEFSNCLEMVSDSADEPTGAPKVFRANLIQTGILFSRSFNGRLALKFGPFTNPACRTQDILDARALGLAGAAGWWPERDTDRP